MMENPNAEIYILFFIYYIYILYIIYIYYFHILAAEWGSLFCFSPEVIEV